MSGAAVVVAALIFPIVIGGLGLGAETGYWYLTQRKLQHAADVSAHAAGVRVRAGDGATPINAAALNIATASGLSASVGSIVVNAPPLSGAKAGAAGSVEVILTEVHPRLFSSVLSSQPVTIRGRAVASLVAHSKACVLALSPAASGAITVSGSTNVDLAGCDIASNSNAADSFLMSGASAALSAGCVAAVGGAVTTSNLTLTQCSAVKPFAPVVRDPYASVTEPSAIGPCQNSNVGSSHGLTTLTPTDNQPGGVKSMRFCNGLNAKGTVSFSPGLYIIENGSLTINGGDLNSNSTVQFSGSGVTFYFVNGGNLRLGSKLTLNLSAPTGGPFSGILFFGSRTTAGAGQIITGASASTLQGAIYMPASDITFTGNSSTTNGCTQVIARTVTFTGSSSLRSSCADSGTSTIATNETVEIVE
jgi:Putative Flp pilus-assembly TadE/G-like